MKLDAAIAFLAKKPRFEAELLQFLGEGHEELVAKLKPYINDVLTLDTYLHAHEGRQAIGRDRMQIELQDRGCPTELIEDALAGLPPESERARALLSDQKRDISPKSARFLLSRGFDEDTVRELLDI